MYGGGNCRYPFSNGGMDLWQTIGFHHHKLLFKEPETPPLMQPPDFLSLLLQGEIRRCSKQETAMQCAEVPPVP
jgi:hypothetical protein